MALQPLFKCKFNIHFKKSMNFDLEHCTRTTYQNNVLECIRTTYPIEGYQSTNIKTNLINLIAD